MAAKTPPKASKIITASIDNIEESRTKRLQRQQSRFRDRGGIFVPSSRNILADILLGKASPVKKPRRSPSLSPCKGRGKSATENPKLLVRETSVYGQNPRSKKGRASAGNGAIKPVSQVSHNASKVLDDSSQTEPTAVTRKTTTRTSHEPDNNIVLAKTPNGKKTPASRRATKSNPSRAKAKKTAKEVGAAEVLEEDEPPYEKKSADRQLTTLGVSPKASSSKSKKMSRNIATDEEYKEGVPKSKRKKSAPKRSSRKPSTSSVPSKPSNSKPGVPQLPDIIEEDDEVEELLPPSGKISSQTAESSKIRHGSTSRNKRPISGEDSLTDPEDRPSKRVKPVGKDVNVKKNTTSPSESPDGDPSPVQRKRRRGEQDEDVYMTVTGKADKPAKRKKVVSEDKMVEDKPPFKPRKIEAKPAKSKSDGKSIVKKIPTKTAMRKENSVAPEGKKPQAVPPRRGIPESILLRIQNSSAPHVVDDEPDPIDFLS